ncbi:unnamed protein product [Linum trigynum]|uniref:Uncharacterized protein n=1 Tax=Linum trigynum TaxID=586398 RepID=A0AAV2DFJ1_9ROSI
MEVGNEKEAITLLVGEEEKQLQNNTSGGKAPVFTLWIVPSFICFFELPALVLLSVFTFPDSAKLGQRHTIFIFVSAIYFVLLHLLPNKLAIHWGAKAPDSTWGRCAKSADLILVILVSIFVGYCRSDDDDRRVVVDLWIMVGLTFLNIKIHMFVKIRWRVLDYGARDMMVALAMQVFAYCNVVMLLHGTSSPSSRRDSGLGFRTAALLVTMAPCGIVVFCAFSSAPVLDRPENLTDGIILNF